MIKWEREGLPLGGVVEAGACEKLVDAAPAQEEFDDGGDLGECARLSAKGVGQCGGGVRAHARVGNRGLMLKGELCL